MTTFVTHPGHHASSPTPQVPTRQPFRPAYKFTGISFLVNFAGRNGFPYGDPEDEEGVDQRHNINVLVVPVC